MDLAAAQRELLAERSALLAELGLDKAPSLPSAAPRKRKAPSAAAAPRAPPAPGSRKSPRLADVPAISYDERATVFLGSGEALDAAPRGASSSSSSSSAAAALPRAPSLPAPPPAGSSRGLPSRVPWVVERLLGRFIPMRLGGGGGKAKAAVMRAAHGGAGIPAFNKYAGVAEFADAAVLFVNLFSPGGGPPRNGFRLLPDGALAINWFGGDAKPEGTPTLLRLRHHATGYHIGGDGEAAAGPPPRGGGGGGGGGDFSPPARVLLALRLDPSLPYVCAGELTFLAHENPGRGPPVEYTWRLAHAAELMREEVAAAGGAARCAAALPAAAALPDPAEALAEDAGAAGGGHEVCVRAGRPRWLAALRAGGVPAKALLDLVRSAAAGAVGAGEGGGAPGR
jgi:hypothetical protein